MVLVILFIILKVFLSLVNSGIIDTSVITNNMAKSICSLQKGVGIECGVDRNEIIYDNQKLVITFLCSGIDQIMFIGILLFSFFGFEDRKTTYEIIAIALAVFMLNYIRLMLFYSSSKWFGLYVSRKMHNFMYLYGQGILLLVIFAVYVSVKIMMVRRGKDKGKEGMTGDNKNERKKMSKGKAEKIIKNTGRREKAAGNTDGKRNRRK